MEGESVSGLDDIGGARQLILAKSKELAFAPVQLYQDEKVNGEIDWNLIHKVEELEEGCQSLVSDKASSSSSQLSQHHVATSSLQVEIQVHAVRVVGTFTTVHLADAIETKASQSPSLRMAENVLPADLSAIDCLLPDDIVGGDTADGEVESDIKVVSADGQ